MKGFLIAGSSSSVGKTSITLGILRHLKNMGLNPTAFKVGPDYIDPKFHNIAAGRPSHNLDTHLMEEKDVKEIFYSKSSEAGVSVLEGVMGLFDGKDVKSLEHTSAGMANLLNVPIVLIVDGSGIAASIAAVVKGYNEFYENVNITGVIVNKVNSKMHYMLLKSAIEYHTNIKCLGYVQKSETFSLSSRHLGLIPAEELSGVNELIESFSDEIKDTIDFDELLKIASFEDKKYELKNIEKKYDLRLGIFKNEVFNFYYEINLEILEKLGVELIKIDPIRDKVLKEVDAIYIGGGFPEVYAKELENNVTFRKDLLQKLNDGLYCYAECGGFMYLQNSIITLDEKEYEMVGFFDDSTIMTKKLQRFGYCEIEFNEFNINSHEFHHSKLLNDKFNNPKFKVKKKKKEWTGGFYKKNTLAGYSHLHFYSNMGVLEFLLERIKK